MNRYWRRATLWIVLSGLVLTPVVASGVGEYHTGRGDALWQTAKSIASDSMSVFPEAGTVTVREFGSDGTVIAEDSVSIYYSEDPYGGVINASVVGDLQLATELATFNTGYFDNPFVSGDRTWLRATGETVRIEGTNCAEYEYRIDYGDHRVTGVMYIDQDNGIPVRMDNELSVTVDDVTIDVVRSVYFGYDGSMLFPAFTVLEGTRTRRMENQVWFRDIAITQEFSSYFRATSASL